MIIVKESRKGNYLVTIVIGEKYLANWSRIVKKSWLDYAEKFDIGIIIFTEDLLPQSDPLWKKANWQKLLIPKKLIDSQIDCDLICYIDSDIIINPFSPDIFEYAVSNKVGVVSVRNNMPFDFYEVNRRLAYLRRKFLDREYNLYSAQHFSTEELYGYHGFVDQGDEFCAGILLYAPTDVVEIFEKWFALYKSDVKSITDGGEQTHLNYHIFSSNMATFLPYRFQAIWAFELAWSHAGLFEEEFREKDNLKNAFFQIFMNNYFVHFAGKQKETTHAFSDEIIDLETFKTKWEGLDVYMNEKFVPNPLR